MRRAVLVLGSVLALAAASCGPYANVAQKLDVTARVVGDTWIARGGPDEIRVLVVGHPSAEGSAPFSFSSLWVPVSSGRSVSTFQGTWVEVGSAGATTLVVEHEYTYPDETGVPILSRHGTSRSDDRLQIELTVTRAAGRLVVAGDARLAGTYVAFTEALAGLGTAMGRDAACAFQIAHIGMLRSQGRIIGFGGAALTQYQEAESYIGTVGGSVQISMSLSGGWPPSHSTATLRYSAFEDIGGVTVDGPMITDVNDTGEGHMSGRMTFRLAPVDADGAPGTPITGWIDYGGDARPWGTYDPANAILIVGGDPVGGLYTISIDGGGTARVAPQTAPSPSVSECLALP